MDGLYRPAFGRGSIADIPGALLESLGIDGGKGSPESFRHISEPADHTVFILIDGLGHSTLQYALNNLRLRNLKAFREESVYVPATSIFPSTTSTATVTLHTGMDPEEHGIIGYIQYLKEVVESILECAVAKAVYQYEYCVISWLRNVAERFR